MIIKEQGEKKVYSDGEFVEKEMLSLAREYPEDLSQDYIAGNSNYTVNNTFSSVRRNILNWYPFKEGADILEIGAGMGSLTGLFCDVANHVTALEMNEARADVIRARYPERKNLNVICDSLASFSESGYSDRKYDYVVFIGVLEYAAIFSESEDPFTEFIRQAKSFLKDDGRLLFAIENRFGLKYWSGASEDHIGKPFVGIEGYEKKNTAKTFSKAELEKLLRKSGLDHYRFYYVFPDYKFPTIISTDEMEPGYMALKNVSFTHARDSQLLFDEKKIYKDLIENKTLDFFANSYLVEAGVKELEEKHVVYVSARGESQKEYRVSTIIDSSGEVKKIAMHPEAQQHIENEYENEKFLLSRGIRMITTRMDGNVLCSQIYHGIGAQDYFAALLEQNDRAGLVKFLDAFQEEILRSSELSFVEKNIFHEAGLDDEVKGDVGKVLKSGYIDMTFYNSFYENGSFVFYDQEWCFSDVPADFILYYAIKCAYNRMQVNTKISLKEILSLKHLEANQKAFDHLEEYIWSTVLYRQTDFYGEDGYCNGYRVEDTLSYKWERMNNELQMEKGIKEEWIAKAGILEKEKAEIEEQKETIEAEKTSIETEKAAIEMEKNQVEAQMEEIRVDRDNKAGHIELLLQAERDLQARLGLITESRAYRLIQCMWKVNGKLLPPGSRRRQLVRKIWHKLHRKTIDVPLAATLEPCEEYKPLCFSVLDTPVVSIVIPVYNEFHYTYACLESVLKNSGTASYEIIVADDCSTDMTQNIEDIVEGITVSRTIGNVGFLKNCNQATTYARGKYILFLNNDTQVQPDWLEPLVSLMETDDSIGMTGSKLLYPDGTLQEAGGILWGDGTGWNYGNAQDPTLPEYNYVKDVDYISGASLMIRRSLWEEIGGFDERFAPAYCEDSDLAFEVRAHGYRVVYQPQSVVIHFEGVSNGTDVNRGVKKYQAENSKKLQDKWRVEFAKQYQNGQCVFRARERSKEKKMLLIVDHYVPTYDKDAGSRTLYQYIKLFLAKGYQIKFLPDNFYQYKPYSDELERMGVEVLYGVYYSQNWEKWMQENGSEIDYVLLNRPHISIKYIDILREYTNARIMYYGMDFHYLRNMREYNLSGDEKKKKEAEKFLEQELYIMRKADVSYFPSEVEVEEIRKIDGDIRVRSIGAFIYNEEIFESVKFSAREGLLFVGGFTHTPNQDGILWFANEIYPRICKQKEIPLYIAGSNAPDKIKELQKRPGIQVLGYVSDEELEQLYKKCRLVVAPLRYGAGVKGKVVEAMHYGVPIVTTGIGIEGIPDTQEIPVADEASSFAAKILEIYSNEQDYKRVQKKEKEIIQKHYSDVAVWERIKEDFN